MLNTYQPGKKIGFKQVVWILLSLFLHFNAIASQNLEYLEKAIEIGDISSVNNFLQAKGSANSKISGWPLIVIAANYQQNEIVSLLINHGADLNSTNHKGDTALILASYNKYSDIIDILLTHGADAEIVGADNKSPLLWAIEQNSLSSVQVMLKHGVKIDSTSDKSGHTSSITPLIHAVINGNLEITQALLNKGANPNTTDNLCESAFSYAKQLKYQQILDLLIKYGASPESTQKCSNKNLIIEWALLTFISILILLGVKRSIKLGRHKSLKITAILLNGATGLILAWLFPLLSMTTVKTEPVIIVIFLILMVNLWVLARENRRLVMIFSYGTNAIIAFVTCIYMFAFSAEEFAMGGAITILFLTVFISTCISLHKEFKKAES